MHNSYTGPYGVIFSLCAATLCSFFVSPLFNNGGILIRDIVYGPIAGGIASVTASYWIINPAFALVIGFTASVIQVILMNLIEKKQARTGNIYNSFSFSLFGIQGIIGAAFAAVWSKVVRDLNFGFVYTFKN